MLSKNSVVLIKLICYSFQKKGHFAKECPNPEKVKGKGKEPTYNNCGLIGHIRKDCPNHIYRKCHQIGHNASECTAPPVPERRPARNRPKKSQRLKKMLPPTQLIQRHYRATEQMQLSPAMLVDGSVRDTMDRAGFPQR